MSGAAPVLSLTRGDAEVTVRWAEAELFRYAFAPGDPQLESPRPYFHPVRTLAGNVVTVYRPHDHVWHKGVALSLPHVGAENFWGGPTFRDGSYRQLPNNGAMRHEGFTDMACTGDTARFAQRLRWVTAGGAVPLTEHRRVAVAAWPDAAAWVLAFETTLANAGDTDVVFASPATEGRPAAGYGGLFWRGPRSFTGGTAVTPDAAGGDELMGARAPWLAFTGRHDETDAASTLVFRDDPANLRHPARWFVRSTPFAAVCPAPFFDAACPLPPGDQLTLRYDIVVADGEVGACGCADLAARAAAAALIPPAGGDCLPMRNERSASAAFPGSTGVTVLDVYDWEAPDGLRGGSAHVHLASTEGYVVLSGAGRLQTLSGRGYAESPLLPGECLWFTPGTVHRLVNDGDLRLLIVMQNAGLPEHGDAVLTFPPEVLADPAAYARAAALPAPPAPGPAVGDAAAAADALVAAAARRRAALAVEGFLALRGLVAAQGPGALRGFHAAATRLTAGHAADWADRWRGGALAAAELTGEHLAGIGAQADGNQAAEHLAEAGLWRAAPPPGPRGYGMCGRLTTYPAAGAARVG
jgi:mannose-6-phosphate isomerase-like protein (cupin superfamily)